MSRRLITSGLLLVAAAPVVAAWLVVVGCQAVVAGVREVGRGA